MLLRLKLFLFFLFLNFCAVGQKKFTVKIKLPESIDKNRLSFHYDNGKQKYNIIKPEIVNDELIISGEYFSKYATLFVEFETDSSGYGNSFWLGEREAVIKFVSGDKTLHRNPLKFFELEQAHDLASAGENKLNEFCAFEINDLYNFLTAHRNQMNDSIANMAIEKSKVKGQKMRDFVRKNGDLYYSFWLFRNTIIGDLDAHPDSLLNIYNTAFSDSLKNSFEGKEIAEFLNGRKLRKNDNYVDFTVKDIYGKKITLSQQKSRYVVLNFWASWCGPCIEKIEYLKELSRRYPEKDLQIILISWDKEYKDLMKAVKKYKINFPNVFDRNEALIQSYGVVGIPDVFLIDVKEKKIIYRNKEEERNLSFLNKILSDRL